jgi:predicted RNase H-like HicB family nuclease
MANKYGVIKAAEEYGYFSYIEGLLEDCYDEPEEKQAAIDNAKAALGQFIQILDEFEQTIKHEVTNENQRINSEVRGIQDKAR